jgi:hypothetical protein
MTVMNFCELSALLALNAFVGASCLQLIRIAALLDDIAGSLRVKLSPVEISIKEQSTR